METYISYSSWTQRKELVFERKDVDEITYLYHNKIFIFCNLYSLAQEDADLVHALEISVCFQKVFLARCNGN